MILAHGSAASSSVIVAAATVAALGYWELWTRHPTRNIAPPLCWTAGMLVLAGASTMWVEQAADRSFTAHMGQHLVLWVVAPPLLLAAHPLHTASRGGVKLRLPTISTFQARRPGWRFALAWISIVVAMYGTHLTGLYDAALAHPWVHDLEHLAYLGSSILLWSTVFGAGRSVAPARAGLAAATIGPLVLLGMVLAAAEQPLYATYVSILGTGGALRDQRQGAALMWIGMMAGFVPLVVLSVWRWAQREQAAQVKLEHLADLQSAADRAKGLEETRARPSVTAEHGSGTTR